jgi:Uma2 family endonuclease
MTSAMRASADPPESTGILVTHRVASFSDQWVFEEGTVPEAPWHDRALEVLKAVLEHWVARTQRDAVVYRDCAVRVRADKPRVGFSPDIMVVEPPPPARYELGSMRLWDPSHVAPKFVAEVVSPGHPWKDYTAIPDQCAVVGVSELVVFDPALVGPKSLGGPWRLQVWRRKASGDFARVESGEGPFESEFLGAHFVTTDEERCLRIANDRGGRDLWPTLAEAERARAESERARAESERARAEAQRTEKERLLARIAEMEAEGAKRPR